MGEAVTFDAVGARRRRRDDRSLPVGLRRRRDDRRDRTDGKRHVFERGR